MLQQMGNIQLEHNLEKNEHWNQMMNYSGIGRETTFLLQHKYSLCLTQDMRKMELTVHTYMLSLLLQTPRDRDAMTLPPLPLHQPSKKGGSVG